MAEAFAVHAKGFGHFQALRCRRSRSENSAFTNSGIIRGKGLFNGAVSASLPQTLGQVIFVICLSVLLVACVATPDTAVRQADNGSAPVRIPGRNPQSVIRLMLAQILNQAQ